MKVYLKTLTPVHIGTGKKLTLKDFFESNRIDGDRLLRDISITKTQEFDIWVNEISSEMNENSEVKISDIIKKFKLDKNYIQKFSLYSFDRFFKENLNEAIKDHNYKFFIPGSSLKGAIRTALMYDILKNIDLNKFLENILSQTKKVNFNVSDSFKKNLDSELEKIVFICPEMIYDEKEKKSKPKYDQKYDLLKILKISDSSSADISDSGEISELNVFALKKETNHKPFSVYTESIKSNQLLEFDISIDIDFLKKAKELKLKKDKEFGNTIYSDIQNKVKSLFDIDLTNKDEEINEEKIINTLLKKLNQFGNEISNLEKKWSDSINNNNLKSSFDKFYQQTDKFKIGYDTGFSGMTILTLLLANTNYKNKIAEIYKKLGIGRHSNGNRNPLDINNFPFTRKFKIDNGKLFPFGWCQMQLKKFTDENLISYEETISYKSKGININPDWLIATIVNEKSKPPKIKLIFNNKEVETILPGVNLENLDIKKGDEVYVTVKTQKSKGKQILQSAEFKNRKL